MGRAKKLPLSDAEIATKFFSQIKRGPVIRPELGPCWDWTGTRDNNDYGRFNYNGQYEQAHRYSYKLSKGPIVGTGKIEIMHECDRHPCVNPSHLKQGTHADNMADMAAKGRARNHKPDSPPRPSLKRRSMNKGEANPRAKLNLTQAVEIRKAYSKQGSMETVGQLFGVSRTTVWRVVNNMIWIEESDK